MRIEQQPSLPINSVADLVNALQRYFSRLGTQLNAVSEGQLVAAHNAGTAAPTTGTYAVGDFIRNSAPAEAGSALSKYVIFGWVCVTGGTPGTWKECRFLTGN